jgi:hypothetical protein
VFILWLIILVIKDYPLEVFQPQQQYIFGAFYNIVIINVLIWIKHYWLFIWKDRFCFERFIFLTLDPSIWWLHSAGPIKSSYSKCGMCTLTICYVAIIRKTWCHAGRVNLFYIMVCIVNKKDLSIDSLILSTVSFTVKFLKRKRFRGEPFISCFFKERHVKI